MLASQPQYDRSAIGLPNSLSRLTYRRTIVCFLRCRYRNPRIQDPLPGRKRRKRPIVTKSAMTTSVKSEIDVRAAGSNVFSYLCYYMRLLSQMSPHTRYLQAHSWASIETPVATLPFILTIKMVGRLSGKNAIITGAAG